MPVSIEGTRRAEAASRLLRKAARQEARRADFSYCLLLHTRPMILFTGAGRPVSGMYFVQAQCGIWQCPRCRDWSYARKLVTA
jgi:hypothetical protein